MAKKRSDETDALVAYLRAAAPKKSNAAGVWEIARTGNVVFSSIKYILTTGIEPFDQIVGGMPFGRIVELYGLENSGKTAMAIRCAARAKQGYIYEVSRNAEKQLVYRLLDPKEFKIEVVYVDNEQSLDDAGNLHYEGQQIDVVGARFDTTDDVFKCIHRAIGFQQRLIEKEDSKKIKHFMLIVVDTIASTATRQELEQAWGEQDYPRQAQQISKALRKLVRLINRYNICLIFTNQVRMKFQAGQMQASRFMAQSENYSSVGGMAPRFYASHRVFMQTMNQKYKLVPDARFSAGLQVNFHTQKNRLRPPLRDGRMVLLFDREVGGFHNLYSILETLILLGFVEVQAKEKQTDFVLKFRKHNIALATFNDDDWGESGRRDPSFKYRCEWPAFYAKHREDVEKLWSMAIDYSLNTEGLHLKNNEDALETLKDEDEDEDKEGDESNNEFMTV